MVGGTGSEAMPTRRPDLMIRVAAGIAMMLLALAGVWFGGVAFWLLVSAAAMLMLAEWADLLFAGVTRMRFALVALAIPLIYAFPLLFGPDRNAVALLAATAVVVGLALGNTKLAAGLVYAGLPALGLMFLRGQPAGMMLALWTMAIVWATDIGAYFAGRAIGGPKLAPAISPSKTWAGLAGGVIWAAAVGAAIAIPAHLPFVLALIGGPLAIVAQGGDLFESWLKRQAGVKDSGNLLPGHGGVLDRLDGLVPVAVIVAALCAAGLL